MNNDLPLSPVVETYICWLIDNQPEALQVCNIGDLAIMYAEECGIEASAPFVQNFYESCLKFLRRLEKSAEPLKVIKAPSNNISTNAPADDLKRFNTQQPPQYHSLEPQMDYDSLSGRHRRHSSDDVNDAKAISRIRPRPHDATLYSTTNSTIAYAPESLNQPSTNQSLPPVSVNETPKPAQKVEPILSRFFSFQSRPS